MELIIQKYHDDGERFQESKFLHWLLAVIRPKYRNFNVGHVHILSIGNFKLMIKNHIPLQFFDCNSPLTSQQPKNLLPISVATRNFPIYLIITFTVSDLHYQSH
jgi:hypothetical protein